MLSADELSRIQIQAPPNAPSDEILRKGDPHSGHPCVISGKPDQSNRQGGQSGKGQTTSSQGRG